MKSTEFKVSMEKFVFRLRYFTVVIFGVIALYFYVVYQKLVNSALCEMLFWGIQLIIYGLIKASSKLKVFNNSFYKVTQKSTTINLKKAVISLVLCIIPAYLKLTWYCIIVIVVLACIYLWSTNAIKIEKIVDNENEQKQ